MNDKRAALIETLYERFNARDVELVVAMLDPEVDWPNGWKGGREHGRDAVRAYWLAQWAEIDPRVVPQKTEVLAGGILRVHVHQIVRDKSGTVLSDTMVLHDYTFADGLVVRMEFGEIK